MDPLFLSPSDGQMQTAPQPLALASNQHALPDFGAAWGAQKRRITLLCTFTRHHP